jgi:hypothetical protein
VLQSVLCILRVLEMPSLLRRASSTGFRTKEGNNEDSRRQPNRPTIYVAERRLRSLDDGTTTLRRMNTSALFESEIASNMRKKTKSDLFLPKYLHK